MDNITLSGAPFPAQMPFFLAENRHICYGGARSGGKSWAMRRKFVLLALKYPGLKLLLMRRTFAELEGNHILPLMVDLKGIAKYTDSKKVFRFPNGSFIKLGFCDAEKDVYQYQGQEYDVIGLEEATHFTDSQRIFIATCNRGTREDFRPRMYYTCNPGGVGHAWVKRLFVDRNFTGDENPDDYVFFPAKLADNPIVNRDEGYKRILMAMPETLRRAHLDGDWDVLEGQYFTEWRRDKHVIEPFEIPKEWKRFRSMDWGYNDPCCVLWHAVDSEGRVYTYRELYIRQTLARFVAQKIVELTEKEEIAYTVASPDMWQKRGIKDIEGESIAETFMRNGVPIIKADNNRKLGWQRMREFLADADDGKPQWQIFDCCKNLTRTLPEMQFDKHVAEDIADGLEDHACLTGDTLVKTTEGYKPIESLVGTTGLCYCKEGVSRYRDVRKTRVNAPVYEVTMVGGVRFKATAEHKILADDGWITVAEIDKWNKVKRVEFAGYADVYNMEVDEYHNFAIQGGVIVHNCESARYALMSRPTKAKIIHLPVKRQDDPFTPAKVERAGFYSV